MPSSSKLLENPPVFASAGKKFSPVRTSTLIVDTQFEKIPAHDVVGIRVIIQPEELQELFDRGYAEVKKLLRLEGIEPDGPARAYYFGEISDTLDVLIGFPVGEADADALRRGALSQSGGDIDDVVIHHFRDMKAMHSRHRGALAEISDTWNGLYTEIENSGCTLPANTIGWEEFVSGLATVTMPDDQVTEVYVQVCQAPA